MPLYDFKCTAKGCKTKLFEEYMAMSEVHKGTVCPQCGKKARRIFDPTPFKFDFRPGFDVGQGKYFDSAKQRNDSADKSQLRRMTG